MEEYKLRLKVFKNTEDDKRTLLRTVQEFIRSNSNDCEIVILRAVGQDGTPILEEFFSNLGFNMDSKASVEESLSRKEFLERARNRNLAIPEMTFHLYNCDNTYDLDKVEALIEKVTTKLSRKATIRKNYFPLPQMKKLCRKLEDDGKQPGYAVFVVHAHESVLAINTDNPHVGYSHLYRTLLKITDDRVLIVIGGDDEYKDQGERDKSVLSRWAWNKICSQFNKKYMNGVKSFIFSWDDGHHVIHEEALEFYLNKTKTGQEFVLLPKPKPLMALLKDVEQKKESQPELKVKDTTPEKTDQGLLRKQEISTTPDFHVLSFYSKKESVSIVQGLLAGAHKKLDISSKTKSPNLHPSDYPQYITDNKPKHLVLVSEMNDFKNIRHLENWIELYKDILKSIQIIGKGLIFVVCGDPGCKHGSLTSELVQEQFSMLNPGFLPADKITIMSWNTKFSNPHQDAVIQLLKPPKSHETERSRIPEGGAESRPWPTEAQTDIEKGRLRYRAIIRRGRVVEVWKSDPPGWEPEESMVKPLLDKHKNLVRSFLEFWENKEGGLTAIVVEKPTPLEAYRNFIMKSFVVQ